MTASDAGSILGENPRRSAWDTLVARRGEGAPDRPLVVRTPSSPPRDRPAATAASPAQPISLRRGNANEPLILRELGAILRGTIEQPGTMRCPGGLRWLVSRPDGILRRGGGLPDAAIEVKCHGAAPERAGVPRQYRAQVQVELLASGLGRLYFVQSWTEPGEELVDEAAPPLLITAVYTDATFGDDVRALGLFREALLEARRAERDRDRGADALARAWVSFAEAARTLFRRRYPGEEPNLGAGPLAPMPERAPGPAASPLAYVDGLGGSPPAPGERPEWDAAFAYRTGGSDRRAAFFALLSEAARAHPDDPAAAAGYVARASGSRLPSAERRRNFVDLVGWPRSPPGGRGSTPRGG